MTRPKDPRDDPRSFCPDRSARCPQGRRSSERVRRTDPHRTASLDRCRSHRGPRRRPLRTHCRAHELSQRKPAEDRRNHQRRHRGSDPEAALRVVLSQSARTTSAHRSGPVRGDHFRPTSTAYPPATSTTSSPRWVSTRESRNPRSRGSAQVSTPRSRGSANAR